MAAYIAIFLSIVCIVLLATVLIKFKRLFSTDAIIEKTKIQMNKIISDINKNANMDIDLINDATKRTRTLMVEAEEKMDEFKEASRLLRDMIATAKTETSQIHNHNISNNPFYAQNQLKNSLIDEIKPVSKTIKNQRSVTNNYKANAYLNNQQSLFGEDINSYDEEKLNIKSQEIENYTTRKLNINSEDNENLIPKIVTNIIPDDNSSKKSLNDKVERLFMSGKHVEDIARELSCSISEVQFIIDMINERN